MASFRLCLVVAFVQVVTLVLPCNAAVASPLELLRSAFNGVSRIVSSPLSSLSEWGVGGETVSAYQGDGNLKERPESFRRRGTPGSTSTEVEMNSTSLLVDPDDADQLEAQTSFASDEPSPVKDFATQDAQAEGAEATVEQAGSEVAVSAATQPIDSTGELDASTDGDTGTGAAPDDESGSDDSEDAESAETGMEDADDEYEEELKEPNSDAELSNFDVVQATLEQTGSEDAPSEAEKQASAEQEVEPEDPIDVGALESQNVLASVGSKNDTFMSYLPGTAEALNPPSVGFAQTPAAHGPGDHVPSVVPVVTEAVPDVASEASQSVDSAGIPSESHEESHPAPHVESEADASQVSGHFLVDSAADALPEAVVSAAVNAVVQQSRLNAAEAEQEEPAPVADPAEFVVTESDTVATAFDEFDTEHVADQVVSSASTTSEESASLESEVLAAAAQMGNDGVNPSFVTSNVGRAVGELESFEAAASDHSQVSAEDAIEASEALASHLGESVTSNDAVAGEETSTSDVTDAHVSQEDPVSSGEPVLSTSEESTVHHVEDKEDSSSASSVSEAAAPQESEHAAPPAAVATEAAAALEAEERDAASSATEAPAQQLHEQAETVHESSDDLTEVVDESDGAQDD